MALPAATYTHTQEVEEAEEPELEDFEVLIDEPHLAVVRVGTQVVAEVHSPVDLSELGWNLAQYGYVVVDMIAFHDGVMEMLLRPLGEIPLGVPEGEKKIMEDVHEYVKEREKVYG